MFIVINSFPVPIARSVGIGWHLPRRFAIGAPLKTNKIMIDDAIESIMEVLEDETRDLSSLDRMEVLNGIRERIDELTEAAIIDEQ